MNLFGSIVRTIVNPATIGQLLTGPAGWATLAARTLGAAIGKELIGAIGRQLGLPPSVIGLVQNSFAAATGTSGGPLSISAAVSQLGEQFNLSATQQGQLGRAAQADYNDMFSRLQEAVKEAKSNAESRSARGGQRSWLQAIADSLAVAMDKKVNEMDRLAQALDKQGSNRSVKSSTDLTVAGQEFQYLMSATSTVIKSIGEGLSSMARKQ